MDFQRNFSTFYKIQFFNRQNVCTILKKGHDDPKFIYDNNEIQYHPPLKLLFRLTLSKNELGNFPEFSFELL